MSERARLAALQALFGWLNLALTAPSVYLWLGLPLLMRQRGWSGMEIGLFQLAALPAVLKFLLARPVEHRGSSPRRYRGWALGLLLALASVLVVLGHGDLLGSPLQLFILAFGAALLATWADILVNALAIRCLPRGEQLRAGAFRSAALSLGAIVGGGAMLMVQLRHGWQAPFYILAGMLVCGAALLCLATRRLPQQPNPLPADRTSLRLEFSTYLEQPGAKAWTVLLMLYFPFVGTAWFYLKPLMLDLGFEAQQVAQTVGMGGGLLAAVASWTAIPIARRVGMQRAVPLGAVLGFIALTALALATATQAAGVAVIVAACGVAIAMGYIAALAFGLTMHFARQGAAAIDYGLQASLFSLSRLLAPAAAGALLDRWGYTGMLVALAVAMLGVSGLSLMYRKRLPDSPLQA